MKIDQENVTPHILHHSFATPLLEKGTDLKYIQELLRHNGTKTTEIYTHVSRKEIDRIRNPVDDFFMGENSKCQKKNKHNCVYPPNMAG